MGAKRPESLVYYILTWYVSYEGGSSCKCECSENSVFKLNKNLNCYSIY